VESTPSNIQIELIELQCSDMLKAKYDSVGTAETFHSWYNAQAALMFLVFSTYLCEQLLFDEATQNITHELSY